MATPGGSFLTVVIVAFNSRADLERSLPAVAARDWHVVVVDNASTDGSAALVEERFPDVEVVALSENLGYAAASNEGLKRGSGSFILLLNPDAWPVDDGVARLLDCAARNPTLGAAGPQLYSLDGRRQQSFIPFPTRWWLGGPAITSTSSPPRRWRLGLARNRRRFLVGAALLLRREAVEQIGGFDGNFFMFYEEVDLCWRLLEAGWEVGPCDDARFIHVGGSSTRRNWPVMYREQLRGHLRFLAKHHGMDNAEFARKVLARAVKMRTLLANEADSEAYRAGARWLASGPAATLLADETLIPSGEAPTPR
jgi:GT2 family glycosyltransferase